MKPTGMGPIFSHGVSFDAGHSEKSFPQCISQKGKTVADLQPRQTRLPHL